MLDKLTSATYSVGREVFLHLSYVALSIGVPIYYLWFNYDLVQTYDAGTKLRVAGVIIALIVLFFGKGYLSAFVYGLPLTKLKKLLWGIERVLPLLGLYLAVNLVMSYGDFAKEMLGYTILANGIAYLFAPTMIVKKKNITGS